MPESVGDHHDHSSDYRHSTGGLVSLASRVFHDVNNRLLVIQFACTKLLPGLSCDDLNYTSLLAIDEARQQAADLTLQFRDAQKAELQKYSGTDLNELVRRWEPLLMGVARENVIIEIDLTSKPAIVMACHDSVERILMHLSLSALALISDGGWLNIHTSHTNTKGEKATASDLSVPITSGFSSGSVLLSITDTSCEEAELTASGGLISAVAQSSTIKNAAIRRSTIETVGKIVDDCGGRMSVTTSEEAGTRVDIFFPLVPDIDLPPIRSFAHSRDGSGTETILLVDDDMRVRKFIKCALESQGYKVIEAGDGCSAINMATEHSESLHLLVTDLRLGGTSGLEVADRLRSDCPGLPVIFMSGLARGDLNLDASSIFLEKPFKPTELITNVRRLLDIRQSGVSSHLFAKDD
ncbi:MAG: response regulator [Schlesneria sp.]